MERLDLDAIKKKWLNQCGYCDAGLPMGCSCTMDDPRPLILRMVNHLEDIYNNHTLLLASTMGEAFDGLEKLSERVRFLEAWQRAAMTMLNMKIATAAQKDLDQPA